MLNQQSESLIKTMAESFRDDMNAGISEIGGHLGNMKH